MLHCTKNILKNILWYNKLHIMSVFNYNLLTKTEKHDDYMTPKSAWLSIKDYIPLNKVIWEAFYGDGQSGNYLQEIGFEVIHNDIDFFKEDRGDIIVSNPPFSKKKKVLQRLKHLDKPFIIICPISMINTNYYRENFGDKCQIIIPRNRIQFIKLENGELKRGGRCNFDCAYYCYKIGLDRDIIFL